MGITPQTLDNALYDAFGQRQVSTMYRALNQYHVVMEVAPEFQQTPEALQNIYLRSTAGTPVPLAAFTHYEPSNTPLAVNHQGQIPSVTISFNLAPGVSLGQATQAIDKCRAHHWISADGLCQLPGSGRSVSGFAFERADPDSDGANHGLYRAGHAV